MAFILLELFGYEEMWIAKHVTTSVVILVRCANVKWGTQSCHFSASHRFNKPHKKVRINSKHGDKSDKIIHDMVGNQRCAALMIPFISVRRKVKLSVCTGLA